MPTTSLSSQELPYFMKYPFYNFIFILCGVWCKITVHLSILYEMWCPISLYVFIYPLILCKLFCNTVVDFVYKLIR